MFYGQLKGVADPEAKRKVIRRHFVEVFQAEAKKMPNAKWLAQGTIYSGVIESAGAKTGKAVTIKSHHNVGGLPESLHLKLLGPLRELFKDEVRSLGLTLGLPRDMVFRYLFPGPAHACAKRSGCPSVRRFGSTQGLENPRARVSFQQTPRD